MSLDPPSGDPSHAAEGVGGGEPQRELAATIRLHGAALIDALEQHLQGAGEHAEATGSYAFILAAKQGLGRARAEAIREAAKLHDIGLVYIGIDTLRKTPDVLGKEELEALSRHPQTGAQLARGAGIPELACEWLRSWGERFDGRGPLGLAGEAIPPESRIIQAACRCDAALTRSHSGERGAAAARQLREMKGTILDPAAAEELAAIIERS